MNMIHQFYCQFGKRAFDLVLTIPALIVFSPLFVIIAVLVRVKLGAPILFRQQRPGRTGQPFTVYKFRTMTDAQGPTGLMLPDAERLTNFGRWLRNTSLDELPELLNVLKGEMSLVGPRPLLMRYFPYFSDEERLRFTIRPGITGLAQISGRNDLSWDERCAVDVQYVHRCSFLLDVRIMSLTLWRVIDRRGLQVDPGATMLDFDEERRRRAAKRLE